MLFIAPRMHSGGVADSQRFALRILLSEAFVSIRGAAVRSLSHAACEALLRRCMALTMRSASRPTPVMASEVIEKR